MRGDKGARPGRIRVAHGDDVDADVAGVPHEVEYDRAVEPFEPSWPLGLANQDLRHVVGARVSQHIVRDAAAAGGNCNRFHAEPGGEAQRLGDAVAARLVERDRAPGLHMQRDHGRVQSVGHALGVAHQCRRVAAVTDADQHAFARRPWSGDGVRLHVREQLVVDPLRRAPQRQFAQGGEVARRKEVAQGALGLARHVDLAVPEPLDQILG